MLLGQCWFSIQPGPIKEEKRMRNEERFLWLLAGIGLGAGAALLLAPKSGSETREYLSHLACDGRDRVTESGQDILQKGKEAYERGKAVVEEAMDFVERGGRRVAGRSVGSNLGSPM